MDPFNPKRKKVTVEVREYSKDTGVVFDDLGDSKIVVQFEHNVISLFANKDGLISLASFLLLLAQDEVTSNLHFHFDAGRDLEEGSKDLVIGKM